MELLSIVALTEDLPERELYRGRAGTIVEVLSPGIYEVEFSDDEGRTDAVIAIAAKSLTRL